MVDVRSASVAPPKEALQDVLSSAYDDALRLIKEAEQEVQHTMLSKVHAELCAKELIEAARQDAQKIVADARREVKANAHSLMQEAVKMGYRLGNEQGRKASRDEFFLLFGRYCGELAGVHRRWSDRLAAALNEGSEANERQS